MTTRERRTSRDSPVTGHLLVTISIGVAVGMLILIGVIFFVGINEVEPTSPTLEELGSVVGSERAVESYSELRQQRFEDVKGLLQLMIIALAVPVLVLVLAYFTERQPKLERQRLEDERRRLEDERQRPAEPNRALDGPEPEA